MCALWYKIQFLNVRECSTRCGVAPLPIEGDVTGNNKQNQVNATALTL